MAKDFSKLTDEKLRAQAERLRPRMERADREAAWLFAHQLALHDADDTDADGDEAVDDGASVIPIIQYARFRPTQLALPKAAGVQDVFPAAQPLPPEWFGGDTVTLYFSRDAAGAWRVERFGTVHALSLQFWSLDGSPIGQPIRVAGGAGAEVPVSGPAQISRIEITVIDAEEPDA